MDSFLQIVLIINVFFIGVVASIAIRHAYAHFRPQKPEPEKPHLQQPTIHIPPELRDKIVQKAQGNFESVLERSAVDLEHDLKSTVIQLNRQLEKLGNDITSSEMKKYNSGLEQLRNQMETMLHQAQDEVLKHQDDLTSKLNERQAELEHDLETAVEDEKQKILQNLDTKLVDAVSSFLVETLGHEVDLGAQHKYLIAMLEEHKEEIKKGIKDEV